MNWLEDLNRMNEMKEVQNKIIFLGIELKRLHLNAKKWLTKIHDRLWIDSLNSDKKNSALQNITTITRDSAHIHTA